MMKRYIFRIEKGYFLEEQRCTLAEAIAIAKKCQSDLCTEDTVIRRGNVITAIVRPDGTVEIMDQEFRNDSITSLLPVVAEGGRPGLDEGAEEDEPQGRSKMYKLVDQNGVVERCEELDQAESYAMDLARGTHTDLVVFDEDGAVVLVALAGTGDIVDLREIVEENERGIVLKRKDPKLEHKELRCDNCGDPIPPWYLHCPRCDRTGF